MGGTKGKLGKAISSKVEDKVLAAAGQPTNARISYLTGRIVGASSKRQERKLVRRAATHGSTKPLSLGTKTVQVTVRAVSHLAGRIAALLAVKGSVVLLMMMVCAVIALVMAIISSFIPSWLTADEADNPTGADAVGMVAVGMGNDYPYADKPYNTINYDTGEYFRVSYTAAEISSLISSGQAVVKHNPNSTVQVTTVDGVSTVSTGAVVAGTDTASVQAYAKSQMSTYGWNDDQFQCLVTLWNRESGWRWDADNPTSDAYGIPQALPGSKMASAGADWETNPATQINWGLAYISGRYGTPCDAVAFWDSHNWY
ncbi:hypothetical protein [Actinomyces trachealis]|uniref:aggregation-promoting factor C-terminal-like domain-containing protein n=1 Tax=Actinomyces trachealis TaxID=2763540 RepID=UPI002E2CD1BA|nr:hypothetical protein [Actinomyces trachealis]